MLKNTQLKLEESDKKYLFQRFQKQVFIGYIVILMIFSVLLLFLPKTRVVNFLLFIVLFSIAYAVVARYQSYRKRYALDYYKKKK